MKQMKEIQDAINNGDYERVEMLLQNYVKGTQQYDDITAVLSAAVREHYEDRNGMWDAVRKGLLYNCRNYELYLMLGNYYLAQNLYQSFLCYENALFHCNISEDRAVIENLMNQFRKQYSVSVKKVSIVILSYDLLEYTKACIESIRGTTPDSAREIVVVDNGSKDGSVEWLREQPDIILVENKENRGFPGGCNQGIRASSEDSDIFLLNNDTILPENALFWLRMGLYEDEKNGSAGSVSNCAGGQIILSGTNNVSDMLRFGEQTNIPMRYPYEDRVFLVGFALLIKRSVLNRTGLLDERFFPGNNEDVDLGLRILKAGYKNILCKNSYILHFGSRTFEKNIEEYQAAAGRNRKKINEKWGFDVNYYLYPGIDLIDQIKEPVEKPVRILDVGCGCGASMGYVRGIFPAAQTYGIEIIPQLAQLASCMGEVLCGDVEKEELPWSEEYFDYILMGDILEELAEPEKVLKRLRKHLKKDGSIIVRVSNMKHYSVILPLLRWGRFSYGDAGILDKTHVKMYTDVEICRLVIRSGYMVETLTGKRAAGGPGEEEDRLLDGLQKMMGLESKETFLAYQYIIRAKRDKI